MALVSHPFEFSLANKQSSIKTNQYQLPEIQILGLQCLLTQEEEAGVEAGQGQEGVEEDHGLNFLEAAFHLA